VTDSDSSSDALSAALAATVHDARVAQGLSVAALAEKAGVSRAMIAKIERGESQPTAVLLGRLSAALAMTLSELIARAEGDQRQLIRRADQQTWTDPDSGYLRRAVSPPGDAPLELVEVTLPPGAHVAFPAGTYPFIHQQIWLLEGRLRFRDGHTEHELAEGDCLRLGPPRDRVFINPAADPCRYLVVLAKRS
jgi:transcriptional regulator with XRE-family HTH domain